MPAHGLLVVEVGMDTVSKDSMGTQEVVRQVALQRVRRDRQDCQELRGLQELPGLETMEVLQTGRQGDQGHRDVWVHIEGIHLGPMVGVDEVTEVQNCCCCLRCCRGLWQVVRS